MPIPGRLVREDSTEAEEQNEKRQKPTEVSESKMKRKYETSQDEAETQNRSMKQRFAAFFALLFAREQFYLRELMTFMNPKS